MAEIDKNIGGRENLHCPIVRKRRGKDSLLDKKGKFPYTGSEVITMRDIGKNIRELRMRRAMTQDELAAALFVTRQTVSNYETGRSRPDVEMLLRIAEVLQIDIHHLLYGPPVREDRRRELRRLIICACVIALEWAGRLALRPWAMQYTTNHFGEVLCEFPLTFLDLAWKPAGALLFGWTVLQGLSLCLRLHRFPRPWGIQVRRLILAGLAVNAAVFWGIFCYVSIMYYGYGAAKEEVIAVMGLPWRLIRYTGSLLGNSIFLALVGGLLWYFGFPAQRHKQQASLGESKDLS